MNRITTTLLLAVMIFSPVFADAQMRERPVREGYFCEKFNTFEKTITERVEKREKALDNHATDRLRRWSDEQARNESQRQREQDNLDKRRERVLARLETKADSPAKQQAIIDFQSEVGEAVIARRATLVEAHETYKDTVSQLFDLRKQEVSDLVDAYRSEVKEAITEAQDACRSDAADVSRQDLRTAISLAQDNFMAGRELLTDIKTSVKDAGKVRNQTYSDARDLFRDTFEQARDVLLAALEAEAAPANEEVILDTADESVVE